MKTCKHNIEESYCTYCNGMDDKKIQEKQSREREKEEITTEKIKYEELKSKFENLREDWEDDEYQILYDQLNGLRYKSTKWRRAIYQTAMILGRTRSSIVWHWKHMFIIKNDPKAGKNLLKFKQLMKIDV